MDETIQLLQRAKQQAYRLLTYRSQTSNELSARLQQRGFTTAIIAEVLSQLAADGYIDDYKVARDWVRYRLQTKPLGRRRLAWELQRRGLSAELVQGVLREVYSEVDEAGLAQQAARKYLRSREFPRLPREQQRCIRYLLGLGFDMDMDTVTGALAALKVLDDGDKSLPMGDVE
jgi:regulatory protein